MDRAEVEELARFRRAIDGAELPQLVPIIVSTLDNCIDALRSACGSNIGVELAAALAAELHKRGRLLAKATYAPVVGNA